MATWTCETCDITIQLSSKNRHLKSKKHTKNSLAKSDSTNEDCAICMEPMTTSTTCRSCHQSWCNTCDRNIPKCPYCRAIVPGRQNQAVQQARANYNWYAESDAFAPSRPHIHVDIIGDLLTLQPSEFRAIHHDIVNLFERIGLQFN